MDDNTKQRLVGATVVISLGVIFLPMIFDGGRHTDFEKIRIEIPASPRGNFSSVIEPLTPAEIKPIVQPVAEPARKIAYEAAEPPALDDEIASIIKPIEQPHQIVNQPEAKPDKPVSKPVSKAVAKPAAARQVKKQAASKPPQTAKIRLPVTAWVVQVGSFDNRKNALSLRDTLRKNGFVSFVESFESAGKSAHRVRIGPEINRQDAEKLLNKLRKKMSLSGIVVSYP